MSKGERQPSVAVLTGGGGGVAVACVRAMAKPGARFLLADLFEEQLRVVARQLAGEGVEVEIATCDVSNRDDVNALAERAASLGRVDYLVHTAGVAPPAATDPSKTLEVNLLGTCFVLDAFEPLMAAGGVGICVASIAGYRQFARRFDHLLASPLDPSFMGLATEAANGRDNSALAAYALSKRGVTVQCERRAGSWGAAGARLMSISPGLIVDTSIGRAAATIHAGAYADQSAIGRAGTAGDVAEVVAFLCAGGSYLSGGDILLDGGVVAYMNWQADPLARAQWHELTA